MTILNQFIAALLPLIMVAIPGAAFVMVSPRHTATAAIARAIIVSLVSIILLTFLAATFKLSGVAVGLVLLLVSLVIIIKRFLVGAHRQSYFRAAGVIAIFTTLYLLFALPYISFHQSLPTGDSQKAIIWATDIMENNSLPDYQRAINDLNRDPVDFYTPGLHAAAALSMSLSPDPLATIGFLAIAISLATVGIGLAIARLVFPHLPRLPLIAISIWFILSNVRFLRYLREPGYHLQNAFGELLLFGALFLALSLLTKHRWIDVVLLLLTLIALVLTHQFSAFLAAFILLPPLALFLVSALAKPAKRQVLAPLVFLLIAGALTSVSLGLQEKIPQLFTSTPHLLQLVPAVNDYQRLLGQPFLYLGLAGLITAAIRWRGASKKSPALLGLILSTGVLIILTQGPRIFIDIPPIRTLLYLVIPLSIFAAYFMTQLYQLTKRLSTRGARHLATTGIIVALLVIGLPSLTSAYQLTHQLRTNSTLLPEYQTLIQYLRNNSASGEAILVDDYNKRSSSWMVLSRQPMYTRIAADIARQSAESGQSKLRRALYLNQLAFEKIYSLGSLPQITTLMAQHNIRYVLGVAGSSTTHFNQNSGLQARAQSGELTLFEPNQAQAQTNCQPNLSASDYNWLFKAATLANDIGDLEDTFEHLPASLGSTRLSAPETANGCTYRSTTAPSIRLRFNVGDYVLPLWDQEHTRYPDTSLQLLLSLADAPANLVVETSTGYHVSLAEASSRTILPAKETPIDSAGFITLQLINRSQQVIRLDLIALGPARTP